MDVVFLDAGNLGMHGVSLVVFAHVHFNLNIRLPFKANGPHKEASKQIVQRIAGRTEPGDVGHFLLLSLKLGGEPLRVVLIYGQPDIFQEQKKAA